MTREITFRARKTLRWMPESFSCALLLCLLAGSPAFLPAEPTLPNILIFLADDHQREDYGFKNHPLIKTPNIDQLRTESLLLRQVFTTSPMCAPSRAAFYTGLWPQRNGIHMNHGTAKPGVTSLAHDMKKLGYRTVLSGKSHVKPRQVFPFETRSFRKGKQLDFQHIQSVFESKRPFFLVVASNEPHTPYGTPHFEDSEIPVPDYLVDTPKTRTLLNGYLSDVEREDAELGRVLELLKKSGKADRTLVIYTSDHGNSTFAKWTCYDRGLNVVTLIHWPGQVKAGSTSDALISFVDFRVTLLELLGSEPVQPTNGRSFAQVVRGNASDHRTEVFGIHTNRGTINGRPYPIRSVRTTEWKYIRNFNPDETPTNLNNFDHHHKVRPGSELASWRQVQTDHARQREQALLKRPSEELYHIVSDPDERHNLAEDPRQAEQLKKMRTRLNRWLKEMKDDPMKTEMKVEEKRKDPARLNL